MAEETPKRKPRKSPTANPHSRIAYLRLQAGLSQVEVARLTGIPERTYRRIESGEDNNPGIRHLINIAWVLGRPPGEDAGWVCEPEWLGEICKAEWLEWQVFQEGGPAEPPEVKIDKERFVDPETYA